MGMPEVCLRDFIHMNRETSDWTRLLDDLSEASLTCEENDTEKAQEVISPYAEKWGVTINEVIEKLKLIDAEMEKEENL